MAARHGGHVLILDPMDDAAAWSATAPDGSTPSAALSLRVGPFEYGPFEYGPFEYGPFEDGRPRTITAATVTAIEAATGHLLRRAVGPLDLTGLTELRLRCRADRRAGGPGAPFFLELRLGSAAAPIGDPGNGWHRRLPVAERGAWQWVRMSLDDLPRPVAAAVSRIELRCLDAPFTVQLHELSATRPRMLADADRALVRALTGIAVGGGTAAVAVRAPAEPPPPPPALDIVQYGLRHAPDRGVPRQVPRDHTAAGIRAVRVGEPYDLDYAIIPVAATRDAQAELLEGVLGRLAPLGGLDADGEFLPAELVPTPGPRRTGAVPPVPVVCYRVGVRRPATAPVPIHPITDVGLLVQHRDVG